MKNFIFMIFISACYYGCATPSFDMYESMMPNGDLVFGYTANNSCTEIIGKSKKMSYNEVMSMKYSDHKKECLDTFKTSLEGRAGELCGHEKYRLYGCLNSELKSKGSALSLSDSPGGNYKLKCYLSCNLK